ncbi:MAG: hypothetical protein WBA93_02530 [Microcoleaceae cyanobacterium]
MMAGQANVVAQMLEADGCYCQVESCSDFEGVEWFAMAYLR